MRAYYQWSGGTPADHEALASFAGARPEQMGTLGYTARGRLGARPVAWIVGATVLATGGTLALAAVAVGWDLDTWLDRLPVILLLWPSIALVVVASLAVGARGYRYQVHQHGLVLRSVGGSPQVVPWASLDPGRAFVADSPRAVLRVPTTLQRQRAPVFPAVVVSGWCSRPQGDNRLVEAVASDAQYRPRAGGSPFGWWQMGVGDPARLLAEMEAAMTADGYPATGFSRYVLGRRFTARDLRRHPVITAERELIDPVVGLPPAADAPTRP